MTVKQWRDMARERLTAAGVPDARVDAELMLCHALNISRGELFFHLNDDFDENAPADMLRRRISRVPLQHILGSTAFMDYAFVTDSRALTPRCDTELLCEVALKVMRVLPHRPRVLDLGTGSGVLAITIVLKRPDAAVCAVDISQAALSLAKENSTRLNAQVEFICGDWWAAVEGRTFDIIVTNPPYITANEMLSLQPEVLNDPTLALNGGADGLDFYRKTRARIAEFLQSGVLLMEVGAEQASTVTGMFSDIGNARTHRDLQGVDRVVEVILPRRDPQSLFQQ